MGCSAEEVEAVVLATVVAAVRRGWPALVWADGQDVTAVIGDAGDSVGDLQEAARRFVPELCA